MLEARAAVVTGFSVDFRPGAGQSHLLAVANHGGAIGRTGKRLAIRTMADRNFAGIDISLVADTTTMTLTVDAHDVHLKRKRRPKAPLIAGLNGSGRCFASPGPQ